MHELIKSYRGERSNISAKLGSRDSVLECARPLALSSDPRHTKAPEAWRTPRPGGLLMLAILFSNALSLFAAETPAIPHEHGPQAAQAALKNFTAADGLETTLFASEPMLRNPTDMDIDERGRVWITEGVNYRTTIKSWGVLQPPGDRIVILEDSDGDGVADKATTFYQGPEINSALGICVLGNKAIVSCSPNVFLFTDTDGDGKADKKELLFSGIAGVDHDHGVHAFSFGPDGKLYFNFGNESHQLKGKDSKPIVDLAGNEVTNSLHPYSQGMAFRCDVDGSHLEVLGNNFRNPYEVAVDSFGTLWQSDNDDDGNRAVRINYVMEYGNFGYHDEMTGAAWRELRGNLEDTIPRRHWHQNDPGVVPNLLVTGAGAPTGIAVYEGTLLPEKFRNQMILADAGTRLVRSYPVTAEGAGYRTEGVDLLSSSDTWFRPSDICAAPDGSLYIADWNDGTVGGHNMVDHEPDTMTGRIYRLAPKGAKNSIPKLDLKTAAGAVMALQSPNLSTRYLAFTALKGMSTQAEPALLKLWNNGGNSRLRARALWLLALLPDNAGNCVKMALRDKDPDLRITGLRIAAEHQLNVVPYVKALLNDPSAQVRRECAIALRHCDLPEAPALWAQLAQKHDGRDRWYLEALGIGADRQEDKFLGAWLKLAGDNWNTAAGRDIIWRSRAVASIELLEKIILDEKTPRAEVPRYFRALDFISSPAKNAVLTDLLLKASGDSRQALRNDIAVEALSRLKTQNPDANVALKNTVTKFLASARGTPEFVHLVENFNLQGENAGLLEVAIKYPADETATAALHRMLADGGLPLIENAFHDTNSAASLVGPLGNTHDKHVVPLLLPLVTDASRNVATRRQAVRALSQTREGATKLLALAEADKLPNDVKFTAASELNRVRWSEIQKQAARILPLPQARDGKSLPRIGDLLKVAGDAGRGAQVFRRTDIGCINCHRVNKEGVDLGPGLSEIGTKLGKDALYEAVLDPSAGIDFGYETWQLELKSGDEAYGIIKSETADEVTINDAKAVPTRIKKSNIASRRQLKISLMPAGLQQTMSAQDLADLVEYLSSLKKALN